MVKNIVMGCKNANINVPRGVIRLHNSARWYTAHKKLGFASLFMKRYTTRLRLVV